MMTTKENLAKPLTVEQVQEVVDRFLAEYKGNIPITAVVRATQEEIYGPEASREKIGYRIDGAYHPARGIFTIAASNMGDEGAVRRTLRHELLGHYGLNTFNPTEKRALLDRILETQHEPSLSHIWERVRRDYPDYSESHQAEEVFAFVAEEQRSFLDRAWDKVRAALQSTLKAVGLTNRPLTLAELRVEAQVVANGIRSGHRKQQTFPKHDLAQYRLSSKDHDTIFNDIRTHALATTQAEQNPTAIIIGGQPGSNKTILRKDAFSDLQHNAVKVRVDELREHHPDYEEFIRQDASSVGEKTRDDATAWAVKLTASAISGRRNLLIDGTVQSPANLKKLCRKLTAQDYRVEARIAATNHTLHAQSYADVALTIEKIEQEKLVHRLSIHPYRGGPPIYENHLVDGAWQRPLAGRLTLDLERKRHLTQSDPTGSDSDQTGPQRRDSPRMRR